MDFLGSALIGKCLRMTWGSDLSGGSVQRHLSVNVGLEHLFFFCQLSLLPEPTPVPGAVCHEMNRQNDGM